MTVFGALNGLGLGGSQDFRVLLIFGAMQNQLIAQGEYYRLLTSMFLHIGLIHLLFNSYALLSSWARTWNGSTAPPASC
jgi:membrane associated rhomboid family serine protease